MRQRLFDALTNIVLCMAKRTSLNLDQPSKKAFHLRVVALDSNLETATGPAVRYFSMVPGDNLEDVLGNAAKALRLLAWYEQLGLSRQTKIRAEMDELGLEEFEIPVKAKEA